MVQVDAVTRVGLDVGFKSPRGRERSRHFAGDGAPSGSRRRAKARRAVAAAEDEVLICDDLVGWKIHATLKSEKLTTVENLDRSLELWCRGG